MAKTKRDIYKQLTDDGFDIKKDVDLQDLRSIITNPRRNEKEHERLVMYINNIASIVLKSAKIAGYPEDVKSEIRTAGFIDAINASDHFDSSYTAITAPFSYLYRIIFNKATKVLKNYYKQRYIPFSSMDDGFENSIKDDDEIEVIEHPIIDDYDAPSSIINIRRKKMKIKLKNQKGQCELFLFS